MWQLKCLFFLIGLPTRMARMSELTKNKIDIIVNVAQLQTTLLTIRISLVLNSMHEIIPLFFYMETSIFYSICHEFFLKYISWRFCYKIGDV